MSHLVCNTHRKRVFFYEVDHTIVVCHRNIGDGAEPYCFDCNSFSFHGTKNYDRADFKFVLK